MSKKWCARKPVEYPSAWVGRFIVMQVFAIGDSEQECRKRARAKLSLNPGDDLPDWVRIDPLL